MDDPQHVTTVDVENHPPGRHHFASYGEEDSVQNETANQTFVPAVMLDCADDADDADEEEEIEESFHEIITPTAVTVENPPETRETSTNPLPPPANVDPLMIANEQDEVIKNNDTSKMEDKSKVTYNNNNNNNSNNKDHDENNNNRKQKLIICVGLICCLLLIIVIVLAVLLGGKDDNNSSSQLVSSPTNSPTKVVETLRPTTETPKTELPTTVVTPTWTPTGSPTIMTTIKKEFCIVADDDCWDTLFGTDWTSISCTANEVTMNCILSTCSSFNWDFLTTRRMYMSTTTGTASNNKRIEILDDGNIELIDSDTEVVLYTGELTSMMEYEIKFNIPMSFIMSKEDYQNNQLQDFRIWLESMNIVGYLYDRFPNNQGLLSFTEC